MKTKKTLSISADVAVILLFVYFLVFPNYASEPTRQALYFCGNTLIPSLFIYMVLAKRALSSPIVERVIGRLGYEPLLFLLGSLCGAPIGAKLATELYKNGRTTKKYSEYLTSFSNNASISFVIGYVGSGLYGDARVGIRLFIFQLLSTGLAAVIMKYVIFGKAKPKLEFVSSAKRSNLSESISDSARTIISLCACVIFFIVAGSAISNSLSLSATADALLRSFLEFSSGCAAASDAGIYSLPITAFSLGFTGCSVAMQVKSVTEGRLSMVPYFTGKTIGCTIFTLLVIIFG